MRRVLIKGCLTIGLASYVSATALAAIQFRSVVTGDELSLENALPEGRNTRAAKKFLETGENLYNENPAALKKGKQLFLTACSGCHGHLAEGKIGPALNDSNWNYPQIGESDVGLFETIYGGAQRQMGPQASLMTIDQILLTMAWVRHLYTGPADDASWLNDKQKKKFKPYKDKH
jgi:cytochrome c-L